MFASFRHSRSHIVIRTWNDLSTDSSYKNTNVCSTIPQLVSTIPAYTRLHISSILRARILIRIMRTSFITLSCIFALLVPVLALPTPDGVPATTQLGHSRSTLRGSGSGSGSGSRGGGLNNSARILAAAGGGGGSGGGSGGQQPQREKIPSQPVTEPQSDP
jgi:uncharacterized membrane protein YgcG